MQQSLRSQCATLRCLVAPAAAQEEAALSKAAEEVEKELVDQKGAVAALRQSAEQAEKEAVDLRKSVSRAQTESAQSFVFLPTHPLVLNL